MKRSKLLLIIAGFVVLAEAAIIVILLFRPYQETAQILPSPTATQVPEESVPLAEVTPTPTSTETVTPTPTETAAPTPGPTETATPTPSPTPKPTAKPTQKPEFTYKISAEQGVAPAGYMIVTVTVSPAGDYSVTYDGKAMKKSGSKYYLTVKKLDSGSYRSHVKVTKQ